MARVPWPLTAFVVVMLPTVVSLGLWQLDRAEEKAALEEVYLGQLGAPVQEVKPSIDPFSRLVLHGEYGDDQYYLDNQVLNGHVGYWVLQTFRLDDGARYLVNRGWIKAPTSREELPVAVAPAGKVDLVVMAWPNLGLPPLFGPDEWPPGARIRVQRRDIDQMASRSAAYPMEMRLEAGSTGVLRAAPTDLDLGRERHLGYAVQWFGLGVVLMSGWLVIFFRSSKKSVPHG